MENLTGKWECNRFSLVINKGKYMSYYGRLRYGRGIITFDNGSFSLTSSHASKYFFFWTSFVETVKGKFAITGDDEITVSDIEGRYSFLNGIWVRMKK